MNRIRRTTMLVTALATTVWACSDSHVKSSVASTSQGVITGVPSLAAPCTSLGKLDWSASLSDLMVADAVAACSAERQADGSTAYKTLPAYSDIYLQNLYLAMAESLPPTIPSGDLMQQWVTMRGDPTQCNPSAGTSNVPVSIAPVFIPQHLDATLNAPPVQQAFLAAEDDLRTAGVNLCVAQQLRAKIPGAAGGEALLFTDGDQRNLLEVIRERAQVAMLQYALLGEAFAITPPATVPSSDIPMTVVQQRLPFLMDWAARRNPAELADMGRDFATAVQLHSQVVQEIASLFARSRSARTLTGATTKTRADDLWGPASWYQRLLVLMYGGDPLVASPQSPWQHLFGKGGSTGPLSYPGTMGYMGDWLPFEDAPYVSTELREPEVSQLLLLARRFDEVTLVRTSSTADCQPFDIAASADHIYKGVEAKLRQADCYKPVNGQCPTAPVPPQVGESYLLAQKYLITHDHAVALASFLNDAIGKRASEASCPSVVNVGAFDIAGADPTNGTLSLRTEGTTVVTHLSPKATLERRSLEELGPPVEARSMLRFPDIWEIRSVTGNDVGAWGFNGLCEDEGNAVECSSQRGEAAEGKRTLGAIAAESAARDMLFETVYALKLDTRLSVARLGDYFAEAVGILNVLNADVGGSSFALRPAITPVPTGVGTNLSRYAVTSPPAWSINISFDPNDAFTTACLKAPSGSCTLNSFNGPYSANVAAHPEASIGTGAHVTIETYIADAQANGRSAPLNTSPDWNHALTGVALVRNSSPGIGPASTYVLRLQNADGSHQYKLLAGNVRMADPTGVIHWEADPTVGMYFAGGGKLGTLLDHQSDRNQNNPVDSAYDGFDYPTDWVPPFTAELIGGSPGQSSVEQYMALAASSADEASGAVESAVQGLIQQASDTAALQASVARSAQALQQDRDALCGANNTSCTIASSGGTGAAQQSPTDLVNETLPPALFPDLSPLACVPGLMPTKCTLRNMVATVIQGLSSTKFDVARAVDDFIRNHQADGTVPTFSDFSGGTLQAAFIDQWRALEAPSQKMGSILAVEAAAEAQMDTAEANMDALTADQQANCSDATMVAALAAGTSGGFPSGVSFSPGPYIAQRQKCDSLTRQLDPEKKKVFEAQADAMSAVGGALVGMSDAEAAISQSSATIHSLIQDAQAADSRATLEAQLAQGGLVTSFGIYRRYADYDTVRARALIENSRRYALAARRALEARYVVNLSQLTSNEAFVASPQTWADGVYDYDLSLPGAVGLAVGTPTPQGIYVNKVKDYVSNLQAFIAGYAASRPAAVAAGELDVVSLPGLRPGTPVLSGSQSDYTDLGAWSLHCAASGTAAEAWIPVPASTGTVDAACAGGAKPDMARLNFTLDPWGRLNGDISNKPFSKRFNVRWDRLAVNFVGTGLKDCTKADDPNGCYSQNWIPYNLTHVGPAIVSDYDEIWRGLGVPIGQIEAGKGLAAEIWLDPLKDGWSTSYVAAVARTEFALRPTGGAYELTFPVGPEVVLGNIERIQLLVGSNAWVKQQ